MGLYAEDHGPTRWRSGGSVFIIITKLGTYPDTVVSLAERRLRFSQRPSSAGPLANRAGRAMSIQRIEMDDDDFEPINPIFEDDGVVVQVRFAPSGPDTQATCCPRPPGAKYWSLA